jgi:alpha-galactosidase
MPQQKIVFIGGGSYGWTPTLARDLFVRPGLRGSSLILVDINPEAAEELKAYCRELSRRFDCGWEVDTATLEEALPGADVVCASIAVGGLEAMHQDYHIPEEFGVYHCVGDTVGPGGISRTLRHVPVFVDFARQMERHCPDAWFIHVTNPLSQITRAVSKATSIKCAGLCHNYAGTMSFLAKFLGVEKGEVDSLCVGVNHYTWLTELTCKGKPVPLDQLTLANYRRFEANRKEPLLTNTTDDEINAVLGGNHLGYGLNFTLCEQFGAFPVGESSHVVENFPYYANDPAVLEKHRVRRKGVLPRRAELHERARVRLRATMAGEHEWPGLAPSDEGFSGIVESLAAGTPSRAIVSMPNAGQVSNLPNGAVVETWAQISGSGITPLQSGAVPEHLTGMMRLIVDEQETAVEAALTGNRDLVARAIALSPMMRDKDRAAELADRLIEANRQWLPQF